MARRALNVQYPTSITQICGHNWILQKALDFVQLNCRHLLPPGIEANHICYGIYFADNPWIGRPETITNDRRWGTSVPSANDDYYGKSEGLDPGHFGFAQAQWTGHVSPDRESDVPNLALRAGWKFDVIFNSGVYYCAADTLSHYLNDTPLVADGTGHSEGQLAAGPDTIPNWQVSAKEYFKILYSLACQFYPYSQIRPRLDHLRHISPGRIVNHCGAANYSVKVPPTFLGGNPFLLTAGGTATWPIWVPDEFDVQKLTQNEPEQSYRAASIYLGWALHMLMDLSVPFHAMNTSGEYHQQCEDEFDAVIRSQRLDHLPVFLDEKAPATQPTYRFCNMPVYWPSFLSDVQGRKFRSRYYTNSGLEAAISELVSVSKSCYRAVHSEKRANFDQTLSAFERLADLAIKHTIGMILSVDQFVEPSHDLTFLSLLLGKKG